MHTRSHANDPSRLDRALPLVVSIVLIGLCALIPTAYVAKQYHQRHDLTQLILFGEMFQGRALPEIRELKPEVDSVGGYDGQFYAQLALDPTLTRPDMAVAIDDAGFRGQRIILPALAYILGLGRPASILFAYALLNLGFWYVLFAALLGRLRVWNARGLLAVFAIMWSTGTLISLQRSLTDLPAAALGFLSLGLGETPAAFLVAAALLTKPTSGLFLLRYVSPPPETARGWAKSIALMALAVIPGVFWLLYLRHAFGGRVSAGNNFVLPFAVGPQRVWEAWQALAATPCDFHLRDITRWEWNLFEYLAPLSIALQGLFVLLRPRWRDPLWAVGAAFAVIFFCFSQSIFVEQLGYTRTVLPLTIAFNLLLLDLRPSLSLLYFLAGNMGLLVQLHDVLNFLQR